MHHLDSNPPTRLSALGISVVSLFVLLGLGCGSAYHSQTIDKSGMVDQSVWALRASRVFASPDQYPPERFAAYGILAFRSKVTSSSRDRYLAICEGFLASLPPVSALLERGIPLNQQMATVWPLKESYLADLNENPAARGPADRCRKIVDNIDIMTSAKAIVFAKRASETVRLDGDGPYLLAWSPARAFGAANVPVLVADLSDVTTVGQATRQFVDWRRDIQRDSALWSNGWDLERVRKVMGLWADKYGATVLSLLGIEDA